MSSTPTMRRRQNPPRGTRGVTLTELTCTVMLAGTILIGALHFGNGCRQSFRDERHLMETAAGARALLEIGEQWYIGRQCGNQNMIPHSLNLEVHNNRATLLREHRALIPGGLQDTDANGVADVFENFTLLRVRRTQADPTPRLQLVLRYNRERFPDLDLESFGNRIGQQGVTQPAPVTVHSCRELHGLSLEGCQRRIVQQAPELV